MNKRINYTNLYIQAKILNMIAKLDQEKFLEQGFEAQLQLYSYMIGLIH